VPPTGQPNLVVDSVDAPASVTPGAGAHLEYTVQNSGGAANGSWTDQIWLSKDATWDLDDRLLDSHVHTGGANPLGTYSRAVDVPLYPLGDGAHHVLVRTDAKNQLVEQDNDDNVGVGDATALDIPELTVGGTRDVTVADGDVRYVRLSAADAQKLLLVTDHADAARIDVVRNKVPVPARDLVMPAEGSLVLPSAAGTTTWFVRVEGLAAAGEGTTLHLAASELEFGIVGVAPRRGGNDGKATLTIDGAGFVDGADLDVVLHGADDLHAERVIRASADRVFATFDLDGADLGDYDVVVHQDGSTVTRPDAFEVIAGRTGNIKVYLDMPGLVRPNAIGRAYGTVTFHNGGDTDVYAPILRLHGNNVQLKGPNDTGFDGGDVVLLPQANGGPPGIVPAGATGRWQVFIAPTATDFEVQLRTLDPNDATPTDLTGAIARTRTPELSNDAFDAISETLDESLGETAGDYVRALDDAALEAAGYGVALPSEDDRFNYLVEKARATAPGAPVHGHAVLEGSGAPVRHMELLLDGVDNENLVGGRLWYDGTFSLWDVPAGAYSVEVGEHLPRPAATINVGSAAAKNLELEVRPGETITGTVTRAAGGSPVADANVYVRHAESGITINAVTGADGKYRARGVPPGDLVIGVQGPHLMPVFGHEDTVSAGVPLVFDAALLTGGEFHGVVRDEDGHPLAGVDVSATPVDIDALGAGGATTDEAGAYSIDGLPPGAYNVRARAAGHGGVGAALTVADAEHKVADLQLTEAARLEGSVIDDDGQAIEDALVSVLLPHDEVRELRTDDIGSFVLEDLPVGDAVIDVAAPGFIARRTTVAVGAGGDLDTIVELTTGATVQGSVLDPEGESIRDVDVRLVPVTLADGYMASSMPIVDIVDDAGEFSFEHVAPGHYNVEVSGGVVLTGIDVPAGDATVDVPFSFDFGTIRGTMVDGDDEPLADVTVSLLRDDTVLAVTTTDADGAYRFRVLAGGTYRVTAADAAIGIASAETHAFVPGTVILPDIAPGTETLSAELDGDAIGADGLLLVTRDDAPGTQLVADIVDGIASVPNLEPGNYNVIASVDGMSDTSATAAVPGAATTLTLVTGVDLTGVVTAAGAPVENAVVLATAGGTNMRVAFTDATGAYTLAGLPAGAADVRVLHNGHAPALASGVAVPGTHDVALVAGTTTTGSVVPDAGAAVPSSVVEAVDGDGLTLALAPTFANGAFELGALADGTYDVRVRAAGRMVVDVEDVTIPAASALALGPVGEALALSDAPDELESLAVEQDEMSDAGFGGFGKSVTGRPMVDDNVPPRDAPDFDGIALAKKWLFEDSVPTPERHAYDETFPGQLELMQKYLDDNDKVCPEVFDKLDMVLRLAKAKDLAYSAWDSEYRSYKENQFQLFLRPALRVGKLAGQIILTALGIPAIATGVVMGVELGLFAGGVGLALQGVDAFMTFVGAPVLNTLRNLSWKTAADQLNALSLEGSALTVAQSAVATLIVFIRKAAANVNSAEGRLASRAYRNKAQRSGLEWAVRAGKADLALLNFLSTTVGSLLIVFDGFLSFKAGSQEVADLLEDIKGNRERIDTAQTNYLRSITKLRQAVSDFWAAAAKSCKDDEKVDPTDLIRRFGAVAPPGDPNEIVGSGGFGEPRWVEEEPQFSYEIHFENLGPGSAIIPPGRSPALVSPAVVDVTSTLDDDADAATFAFGDVGFGDVVVDVPDGVQAYSERLGPFEQFGDIFVDVAMTFDPDTRVAHWTYTAIDPETGETPVDTRGFLPPEDGNGAGQGFAQYRVAARTNADTGDAVDAQARIVFDTEEPIDTNVWTNTIDTDTPDGHVDGLAAQVTTPAIPVQWSGADAGSGVASYELYVSIDGGPFTAWLDDTTQTSGTYPGTVGHTYGFAVRATDNVGHREAMPSTADATVAVVAPSNTPGSTAGTTAPGTSGATSGAPTRGGGVIAVARDGGVFASGGAPFLGSLAGRPLNASPVAIARTPSGSGYAIATADGGVFSFGDAPFLGSAASIRLQAPIVDIAFTPTGRGYVLVAEDGGVFTFGDAQFLGSMGGIPLNAKIVAVVMSASGRGYLLVGADGGTFAFGDVAFHGSMVGRSLHAPIVDAAIDSDRDGYVLVGRDGGAFSFAAAFNGSLAGAGVASPTVGISLEPAGGYRLVVANGGTYAFGTAAPLGALAPTLAAPLVAVSG
jgi:protocatechuate 3,4-dioxygenase beta subunit